MCEKPDVYGRSLKTGSLCPWHGGDAVQGTHHTAQTCSDMFTFIWFSVSFLDAICGSCSRYLKGMKLWWF